MKAEGQGFILLTWLPAQEDPRGNPSVGRNGLAKGKEGREAAGQESLGVCFERVGCCRKKKSPHS